LRLASQTALLGEVSDRLIAFTVGINARREISVAAYFDGPPSEEDEEDLSAIATEIMSSFEPRRDGDETRFAAIHDCRAYDGNDTVPMRLEHWIFVRKGTRVVN
jgi:hypothetical protein